MNSDSFIRSFFDSPDSKATFLFAKPASHRKRDLNTSPTVKGFFSCRGGKSNKTKQGIYALHNQLLVFHGEQFSNNPLVVLDLQQSRLKSISNSRVKLNQGFIIARNGYSFEFLSSDKQNVDAWKTALKEICVLEGFLEEYKILKTIGKGSFAKVHLIESRATGKHYAAKTFNKEIVSATSKAHAKAALINEIDIMRTIHHENIIRLYFVYETEKYVYLVMELVQGKPLQDVLKKTNFVMNDWSESRVMETIRSILDALNYIKSKGLMHRDLKPGNMLIEKHGGKIKIIDFGLATFINASDYLFKKCGTPGYIAPEVFKYDSKVPSTFYDDKCDVFSAGCIFFYMLFGKSMMEGKDSSEVLENNKNFNGFDVTYKIKKIISNPHHKMNKDSLNLLLEMIQYDSKKRISAGLALSHVYFKPTFHKMIHISSSKEIIDPIQKYLPTETGSATSINFIGSPLGAVADKSRFLEKSSLYLDVGKPEMNGGLGTITNSSGNNSGCIKDKSVGGSNSTSLSAFAKPNSSLIAQKAKGQSQSFKGGRNFENQLVLKAAIFANMQKSNDKLDKMDEETRRKELAKLASMRRCSAGDSFASIRKGLVESEESSSSGEIDSSELRDLGEENINVRVNFEKVKHSSPKKNPGRMARLKRQMSKSVNKL